MDCTEVEKLVLAKFSLKNEAQIQWEAMGRVHEGDGIPTTFEVFKTEFEKKYVPNMARDMKETKFARLVQGQMLVADFEAKYTDLSWYTPHVVTTPREKACKFQEGLTLLIQNRLALLMIEDYSNVYERALVIEDTANRLAVDWQFQQKRRPGGQVALAIPDRRRDHLCSSISKAIHYCSVLSVVGLILVIVKHVMTVARSIT